MPDSRPKPSRRLADRFASPYVAGLAAHLDRVQDSVLDLHARLDWIEQELREVPKREERIVARIDEVEARIDAVAGDAAAGSPLQQGMLKAIYERGAEQRGRLYELRESADYEAAFTEATPLVSFVIPTYNRFELLRERSLPSILAQSYENLEVIVSGDDSPAETAQVIEEIGDPRVRFINRTVRGPYPEEAQKRWLMSGTPPMNDGLAAAKGRWIAILGDDDEVTPAHTEALVAAAQERRLEHCYGRMKVRFADGGELDWESKFPPAYGHYTLQLAIYHAGLRFFQFEPGDVAYGEPNDWSLARRMAAAGVRFVKIDELVCIKYEDRPTPKIDPVDG
jgi:hypothetical protein